MSSVHERRDCGHGDFSSHAAATSSVIFEVRVSMIKCELAMLLSFISSPEKLLYWIEYAAISLLLATRARQSAVCAAGKLNSCHHSEGRSPVHTPTSPVTKVHRLPYWAECGSKSPTAPGWKVEWLVDPTFSSFMVQSWHDKPSLLPRTLSASHQHRWVLVPPFFDSESIRE